MPTMSDQKPRLLRIPDGFRMLAAVSFIFLAAALSSCEKGCLCHTELGKSKVWLDADWSAFGKEEPTGITVIFENEATGEKTKVTTHKTSKPESLLLTGQYKVLGVNQSPSEFGSMRFEDLEDLESAKAIGVEAGSPTWLDLGGKLIEEPEWLAIGTTRAEVEGNGYYGNCGCLSCECVAFHGQPEHLGILMMENAIWTIRIEVEIEGTEYLSKVRGAISGVPEGLLLWDAKPIGDAAQLLSEWKGLSTEIRCFGFPEKPELILQFLLIDGKTTEERWVPAYNIIIEKDEMEKTALLKAKIGHKLPEVSAPVGGGFDASVDDWGEPGDIELPM